MATNIYANSIYICVNVNTCTKSLHRQSYELFVRAFVFAWIYLTRHS